MTEMLSKKERVIKIVQELQKRTQENGCTEAEALVAATKVSKLMEEYQLSLSDVSQVRDDVYGALKKQYGKGSHRRTSWHETKKVWNAISRFTDTKCWMDHKELVFFGSKTDCEIAFFLCDLIKNTSEIEWKNTKQNNHVLTNKRGRASFMAGFSYRVAERLLDIKRQRDMNLNRHDTSRALVLVKDKVVMEKFSQYSKERNLQLRVSYSRGSNYHGETFGAGQKAGEKVNITSGINNSDNHLRLGSV